MYEKSAFEREVPCPFETLKLNIGQNTGSFLSGEKIIIYKIFINHIEIFGENIVLVINYFITCFCLLTLLIVTLYKATVGKMKKYIEMIHDIRFIKALP